MGVSRSNKSNSGIAVADYTLVSPSGAESDHEVSLGSHYEYSWYDGGRPNELFHVGGGNPYSNENEYEYEFGTYTLIPNNDFLAMVHMWGGGGGSYNSGNDSARAGGGGFTQGLVRFKKDIPYALTVGQGGRIQSYVGRDVTTHGGGGGVYYANSGQGGGLSGIFMNTAHRGFDAWAHNPPVKQEQALLIAGGGGGCGHHRANTHHGTGGAGGGWYGMNSHNAGGGGQTYGGHATNYSAGSNIVAGQPLHGGQSSRQNTWTGAGGGGWWGGGGGGHSGNHYNGGSGGSGHHAQGRQLGYFPNADLAQYVLWANTETGSGNHSSPWQYSANFKSPLAGRSSNSSRDEYSGLYAGKGGRGNSSLSDGRSSSLHGKIVLTLMPELLPDDYFRHKNVSEPDSTEWVNLDDYTKN